jgi:hypothetical protein
MLPTAALTSLAAAVKDFKSRIPLIPVDDALPLTRPPPPDLPLLLLLAAALAATPSAVLLESAASRNECDGIGTSPTF